MAKYIYCLIAFLTTTVSCKQEPSFRIYGSMDNNSCDGTQIFLVPAVGVQTSETVDSTVIKDGKFYFEGCKEQISILRLELKHRLNYQDLLVVTEPGDIKVYYSKKGTTHGTPQNEQLQQWKEILENGDSIISPLRKKWYNTKNIEDSIIYFNSMKHEREILSEYTKRMIINEGRTTLGHFLYMRNRSIFDNEQRIIMDSIFK